MLAKNNTKIISQRLLIQVLDTIRMLRFITGNITSGNLPHHEPTIVEGIQYLEEASVTDANFSDALYGHILRSSKKRKAVGKLVELIRIRVYYGGGLKIHEESFVQACQNFESKNSFLKLHVEDLTVDMIRELNGPFKQWDHPRYLVDWLLDCDLHFILCQSVYLGMFGIWNIEETNMETRRLIGHRGFPKERFDPVMEGDKYAYLELIPEFCNPTLKLPLHHFVGFTRRTFVETRAYKSLLSTAKSFMDQYTDGNDWYLKAPYVQHKEGYKSKWIHSIEQLDFYLKATMSRSPSFHKLGCSHSSVFPYLMLQPRMKHDNESKIILHGGIAQYLSITDSTNGLTRATKRDAVPLTELKFLAEKVIKTLKFRCPHFVSDGLTRVDFFQNAAGKVVVNEVEALDSNFSSCNPDFQDSTKHFLSKFFEDVLYESIILIC